MSTFGPVGSRSSNGVCVCACVRACVRACVCACVRACAYGMNLKYALRCHIHTYQFIPCYTSAIHWQAAHAHTRTRAHAASSEHSRTELTELKVEIAPPSTPLRESKGGEAGTSSSSSSSVVTPLCHVDTVPCLAARALPCLAMTDWV